MRLCGRVWFSAVRAAFFSALAATAVASPVTYPGAFFAPKPVSLQSAVAVHASLLYQQPQPQLSPRELFYDDGPANVGPNLYGGSVSVRPLGLQCSIRFRSEPDKSVPLNTVFHSGDRIVIALTLNQTAWLYVLNEGPAHIWRFLFPHDTNGRWDLIAPARSLTLPVHFDETLGKEKLFILASRQPIDDPLRLIKMLAAKSGSAPSGTATHSGSAITDEDLRLIKTGYSRDLVIEEDERQGHSGTAPHLPARYVVNVSGRPDSPVFTDITLVHEGH